MAKLAETTLQVFEGDDELKSFKLLRESNGNLVPYDLTGATIEFIVKASVGDASVLFDYTTPTEITIISELGGIFTIQFVRTDVATAGNYRYQLRVTQNSKRKTVAWGTLTVENV